jgi:hypothetical protein
VTDKSQLNLGSQTIKNRLQNEKISDKVFKTNNNMAKIFLQQESVKRKL